MGCFSLKTRVYNIHSFLADTLFFQSRLQKNKPKKKKINNTINKNTWPKKQTPLVIPGHYETTGEVTTMAAIKFDRLPTLPLLLCPMALGCMLRTFGNNGSYPSDVGHLPTYCSCVFLLDMGKNRRLSKVKT